MFGFSLRSAGFRIRQLSILADLPVDRGRSIDQRDRLAAGGRPQPETAGADQAERRA